MEQEMEYSKEYRYIPMTTLTDGVGQMVAQDLFCLPIQVVNVCVVGNPSVENEWVLVDAGMPKSADHILDGITKYFGAVHPPKGIVLTHGHFDHVGAVIELAEKWDVPVYAHELELPYLTGQKSYPEPDTSVEGGLIAKLSFIFPNEPINLGKRVQALPNDHRIPIMPGWRWIHTPGHTPGHISFIRTEDHAMIVGDAFVTVKQESLYKVLTQQQEISGPPRYFTTDWEAAWQSVNILKDLDPSLAITGHGLPMFGEDLRSNLEKLVNEFDQIAIPDYGRYVDKHLH
ncbi:MBL fold metallo-hydrolase [Halalkalibacterium halodurans]|uniref:MBL fold metallo-hydrolase n=1 Tax=Halalkalibacterium halodurans TaxID=86665 RepID=UPI001067CB7B|nr:MBL fold metallo-hydrolase [Halalkalibacterium halodurans]TES45487.1 MBL fold metallo-hydrolase [Halalkalibacterium halodurans]